MTRLFHVSEESHIIEFAPRPDPQGRRKVWAIADSHLANYLLPRQCPRVTFYKRPESLPADCAELLGEANHVVAIESAWQTPAETIRLYLYELPAASFTRHNEIAGYYTSEEVVVPETVHCVIHPLQEMVDRDVELRVLTSLWELRERVARSTLGFSIIRFRNAGPRPAGFTTRFPVPGGGQHRDA